MCPANAWMQHPVGYRNVGNKAELADFWAVLRNSTLWAEFSHTVLAAFVTGAMVVLGVSGWQLLRGANAVAFTRSARLAAWVALAGTVAVMVTGDIQARLMDSQPSALAVLMLVPDAYLPVRRLTADFHAGAAGRAVLGRLGQLGSAAAATAAASHGHEGGGAGRDRAGQCGPWPGG